MTQSSSENYLCEELCEIGRRLWQRGLVAAHDGNVSVRLDLHRLICTPTGVSKGFMDITDLVTLDMNGSKLDGCRSATSEIKMHLEIYRKRPDVNAVVHAHPPHGTAFALAGKGLPADMMPEIDVLLGQTPVIPFITPGTQEFANAVGQAAAGGANVLILERHGVTTCGGSLEEAWFRMESLDHCCHVLLLRGYQL